MKLDMNIIVLVVILILVLICLGLLVELLIFKRFSDRLKNKLAKNEEEFIERTERLKEDFYNNSRNNI